MNSRPVPSFGWLAIVVGVMASMPWRGLSADGSGASPLIVAHRGASHDAPENTLAAFRLAWEQGADAIEGDFHLTRDGEIACLHDATTKRTAGVELKVAESTMSQLRDLDVGRWKSPRFEGEKIPTLAEAMETVPAGKRIFIEIKCGPEIVPALAKALEGGRLEAGQTTIIAFDAEVIVAVKKRLPHLKAYWLTSYKQDKETGLWAPPTETILETLQRIGADGLDSQGHERLSDELRDRIRKLGLELHVWTIDDPVQAKHWAARGARSITTNRPGWLREALE